MIKLKAKYNIMIKKAYYKKFKNMKRNINKREKIYDSAMKRQL